MSNPSPDATQQTPPADSTPTPEEVAATAEQRRRDTQAAFTKGQQKIKSLEAENAELIKLAEKAVTPNLTPEQQTELEDLKFSDPVAWRTKLNDYEKHAQGQAREHLTELTGTARSSAEQAFELDRRTQVLKEFNDSAKVAITDEIIANEVPPRITSKLANGTVTFEEFLKEVSEYLGTDKVIKTETTLGQPNLGNLGGRETPGKDKPGASLSDSYKTDLY